jgi:TP901 family phage tail tape measure protein
MPPVVLDVQLKINQGQIAALKNALTGAISSGLKSGTFDAGKLIKPGTLAKNISTAVQAGFTAAMKKGVVNAADLAPLRDSIEKAVVAGINAGIKAAGTIKVAVVSSSGSGGGRGGAVPGGLTAAQQTRLQRQQVIEAERQARLNAATQARIDRENQQFAARQARQNQANADRLNSINAQAAARAAAVQQNAQARIAAQQAQREARQLARQQQGPSLSTQSWRVSQAIQFGGGIVSSLGAPGVGSAIGNVGNFVEAFGPQMGIAASVIGGFAVTAAQAFAEIARAGLQSTAELESAYSRISALTGLRGPDVGRIGQTVESISAGPTVSTTQELANAVYNIASTGFTGARTGQILQASNLASLAGLGDISDTAGLIGKVLTTYGESNISAARATDILTAAVRDGAAEGKDFTAQVGKLLPFANELGIGFDEVAASLAAVSIITRDSAVASTQLQNAYSKLLSPTNEGLTVLDQIYGEGRGAQGVQAQIQSEGFLKTLRDIYASASGNKQVLGDLFGDIRGLSAVLTLANDDFSKFEGTLGRVRDSFGATRDAAGEFTDDTNVRLIGLGNEWDRFTRAVAAPLESPFKQLISDATVYFQLIATNGGRGGGAGLLPGGRGTSIFDVVGSFIGTYDRNAAVMTPEQVAGFGGSMGIESNRAAFEKYNLNVDEMIRQAREIESRQRLQTSQAAQVDYAEQRRQDAQRQFDLQQQAGGGGGAVYSAVNIAAIERYAGEGASVQQAIIEKRAQANRDFATSLGQSLDAAVENTFTLDQQFEKLDKAEAELGKTPKTVTFGGLSARDSKRIKTLETSLEIGRISNRIRERTITTAQANLGAAKKELAVQNGVRRVENAIDRDLIGDIRFQKLQEEYDQLRGRMSGAGTRTVVNPKYQAQLDERNAALQEFNMGGYNLIQDKFIQVLGAAAQDGKTFNNILDSGGDILQAFAESAGLFKTSGFTMQLAQAGLEAKYLRDEVTGQFLQGDALEEGFANYSAAIQKFRDEFADARKFMEGTEPIKVQTLIDFQILDETTTNLATNTKEQKRIMDDAQKEFEKYGDVRILERAELKVSEARFDFKDASTAEGFRRRLLEKYGLDQEYSIKSMVRIESLFSQENRSKLEAEAKQMEETLKGIVKDLQEQFKNLGNWTFEGLTENSAFKDAMPNLQTLFGPGLEGAWRPPTPGESAPGESGAGRPTMKVMVPANLTVNLKTDAAEKKIDEDTAKFAQAFSQKYQYPMNPLFSVDGKKIDTTKAVSAINSNIETVTGTFASKTVVIPMQVEVQYTVTSTFTGDPGPFAGLGGLNATPVTGIGPVNPRNPVPATPPSQGQVKNRRVWVNGRWEQYASGTANMRDGWALVGENGPEIIYNSAPNTGVLNAGETRQALTAMRRMGVPAALDQFERHMPPAPFDISTLPAAPNFGLGHEDYMNMSSYNSMIESMVPMSEAARSYYMANMTGSTPGVKTSLQNLKGTPAPRNYWKEAQYAELAKRFNLSMPMDIYGWSGYNPGARFYERFDSRVGGGGRVSNTNTTLNVDARGSAQPVRVQEAVERAVAKAMRQYSSYEGNVKRGMRARGIR